VATPVVTQKVVCYNDIQPFPIMYTEQDTFDRLRRIPLSEMKARLEVVRTTPRSLPSWYAISDGGWTIPEYNAALGKEINDQYEQICILNKTHSID